MNYKKLCPICNEIQYYKTEKLLKSAIKKNRHCIKCNKFNKKTKTITQNLVEKGLNDIDIKKILKKRSARTIEYWIDKGYSKKDAEFERQKRIPGTYEYFKYFKKIPESDIQSMMKKFQNTRCITEENMIKKYGIHEGKKRWEQYKSKQAYSNTIEYFIEKYGKEEGEKKYYNANKNRAITLKNMIKNYGKEDGLLRWNEYCNKQKYTNTIEYFIEKYGKKLGEEKYHHYNFLKGHTYESYLERFNGDGEKALLELNKFYTKTRFYNCSSRIATDLFNKLTDIIIKKGFSQIYYDNYSQEWMFIIKDFGVVKVDFFVKELGKIIEFYGDYWHANPKTYKSGQYISFRKNEKIKVNEVWEKDKIRISYIKKVPYIKDILIIWENEYRNNPKEVINNCIKFLIGE